MDDLYVEKNKQYKELEAFMKKHFIKKDRELLKDVCEDIAYIASIGSGIRGVFERINHYGFQFEDEKQVNEFLKIAMNVINNTRIWENNGFTPFELFEKTAGKDMADIFKNLS